VTPDLDAGTGSGLGDDSRRLVPEDERVRRPEGAVDHRQVRVADADTRDAHAHVVVAERPEGDVLHLQLAGPGRDERPRHGDAS